MACVGAEHSTRRQRQVLSWRLGKTNHALSEWRALGRCIVAGRGYAQGS
jgi:hypothetical protein